MLINRFSILTTLSLAIMGCGEDALFASETMAGDTAGDDGFSRDIVDVEAAAPGDWANCLLVSEGRLTETTTSQTLAPGATHFLKSHLVIFAMLISFLIQGFAFHRRLRPFALVSPRSTFTAF